MLNVDLRGNAEMCRAIPSYDGKHLANMLMEWDSNAWILEVSRLHQNCAKSGGGAVFPVATSYPRIR
jgi:hypothetical protein